MKKIQMDAFEAATQELAVRGMVIYQNGEELLHYSRVPEARQNQYSVTKSFTAAAVAFAVKEGLFSLEDSVLDHFTDDAPEKPSEFLKEMKLKHLITMSMGFEEPMLMGIMRPKMTEKDWVKFVLRANTVHKPGTVFQYNNAGPYLLGILIQRKAGCSLVEYLMPRLFEPLGIPMPECETILWEIRSGPAGLSSMFRSLLDLAFSAFRRAYGTGNAFFPKNGSWRQRPALLNPRGTRKSGTGTDT